MTKDPLVLTLDMGTSSVRAMLFDRQGRPRPGAEAQIAYAQRTSSDGGVETDAEPLLMLTVQAARRLLRKTDKAERARIAGVGISCFWHSLLGVGDDGRAATPLFSWADTRARAQADALARVLAPAQYHQRTGCVLHPCYWPAKLCWLAGTQPDTFARARTWMSFGEYVLRRLFGETGCSLSMASGTGLLDQNSAQWDAPTLAALPITAGQLNPLTDRHAPQSGLTEEFARVLAPLQGVPWFPTVGDGACSNVGCGATDASRMAINMGTSGAMRVAVPAENITIPPGLFCYRIDQGRFLLGGAFANGGNAYAWLARTLQLGPPERLPRLLSEMSPDGHGLSVLPLWAGERSPGWHAHAQAAICGMNLHTTPLDMLRASLEAIAYQFADVHDALAAQFPGVKQIVASGGALAHDPVWTQILADVMGAPVTASKIGEATSRGAALLTLDALGARKGLDDIPAYLGRTYVPDPARGSAYADGRARYKALYASLLEDK